MIPDLNHSRRLHQAADLEPDPAPYSPLKQTIIWGAAIAFCIACFGAAYLALEALFAS